MECIRSMASDNVHGRNGGTSLRLTFQCVFTVSLPVTDDLLWAGRSKFIMVLNVMEVCI